MWSEGSVDPRRALPSVDRLVDSPPVAALVEVYGRELVTVHAREVIDSARRRMSREGESAEVDPESGGPNVDPGIDRLAEHLEERLSESVDRGLRRVINATGVLLHTNLGRAPLPGDVARSMSGLLDAACDLEIDLVRGERDERNRVAERLLCLATGAEAGLVANNNAAVLVLVLSALARGREVIVSRGELVEIGGSFRIPEILEAAGARLVEVGTTNRTRLEDYERAVGEETALLLMVHASNYRMSGFVESVLAEDLGSLGERRGIPVLVDEGAGMLVPREEPQLAGHPSMAELVRAGVDVVCGSGDKLLGGPQAGLLVGREEIVRRCRRHPLYRALRPGRAIYAALEPVLRRHLTGGDSPLDRLWPDPERHRERLERVASTLGAEIVAADAYVGGGAAPEEAIPGEALALPGSDELARRLRIGDPSVVGRVSEGRLVLDLRTVAEGDDEGLVAAVQAARAD